MLPGMTRLVVVLVGFLGLALGTPSYPQDPAPEHATRVVGYLASWGVRTKGAEIANLPARDLTHIYYAFADIAADGSVTLGNRCVDVGVCARGAPLPSELRGNFGELRRLKARYPHLKLT